MVYLFSNYIFKCNPIYFFPLNEVLFKTKCFSVNRVGKWESTHGYWDIQWFHGFEKFELTCSTCGLLENKAVQREKWLKTRLVSSTRTSSFRSHSIAESALFFFSFSREDWAIVRCNISHMSTSEQHISWPKKEGYLQTLLLSKGFLRTLLSLKSHQRENMDFYKF